MHKTTTVTKACSKVLPTFDVMKSKNFLYTFFVIIFEILNSLNKPERAVSFTIAWYMSNAHATCRPFIEQRSNMGKIRFIYLDFVKNNNN